MAKELSFTDREKYYLSSALAELRSDIARSTLFDGSDDEYAETINKLFKHYGIQTYEEKHYNTSRFRKTILSGEEYSDRWKNSIHRLNEMFPEKWLLTPEVIIKQIEEEMDSHARSQAIKTLETVREEVKALGRRVDTDDVIDIIDEIIYPEEE